MRIPYRPEIDGLRAVAICGVIIYHADLVFGGRKILEGGFLGVDLFFVISGYLITKILLSELETAQFNFLHFYERRARRILPALIFVTLITIFFAWHLLLPHEFCEYAKSIVASLLFYSNLFFYSANTQYSAESSALKPLLHTWSLSVEEQFYLIFPTILVLVRKFSPPLKAFIFFCIGILSLGLAEHLSVRNTDLNFFLAPTRMWEFMAGALVTIAEPLARSASVKHTVTNKLTSLLPMLGLFLIIASYVFFTETMPHPSVWTGFPILGASLIILFSNESCAIGRTLARKPIILTGLISYSLYLWHTPLFAFARLQGIFETNTEKILCIALTTALAFMTYRLVEQPFRTKNTVRTSMFVPTLGVSSSILVGFAILVVYREGFYQRFPSLASTLQEAEASRDEYWSNLSNFTPYEQFTETKISILVVGNSWGLDIANALAHNPTFEVNFRGSTGHRCREFILPNVDRSHKDFEKLLHKCEKNLKHFNADMSHADLVILADNITEKGVYENPVTLKALDRNIQAIRSSGFYGPILIIKNRPVFKGGGGFKLARRYGSLADGLNEYAQTYLTKTIEEMKADDSYFEEFFDKRGMFFFSLVDPLCFNGTCLLTHKQQLLYHDTSHLTTAGTHYLQPLLTKVVLGIPSVTP